MPTKLGGFMSSACPQYSRWAPVTKAAPGTPAAQRPGVPRTLGASSGSAASGTPGGRPLPVVRYRARGSALPSAAVDAEARAGMLARYEEDKVAVTSRGPRASQEPTWVRMLGLWHGAPAPTLPVEPADIGFVGALMKEHGDRS